MTEDWRSFLQRSRKKKPLPPSLQSKVLSDFDQQFSLLGANKRITQIAAEVCLRFKYYDVANFLDRHIKANLQKA